MQRYRACEEDQNMPCLLFIYSFTQNVLTVSYVLENVLGTRPATVKRWSPSALAS